MRITLFSFLMSVLWGSVLIIAIHFCRKKPLFVRKFGVRNLLFLYLFSAARMLVPYEFPFARILPFQGVFQEIGNNACTDRAETAQPPLLSIAAVVWLGISAVLLLCFLCRYRRAVRTLTRYCICEDAQYQNMLQRVMNESGSQMKITVRRSREVNVPMGIGIFKKSILLPEEDYSSSELYYILLHEYTHFRNRDLLIKILVHMFSCIYWWNPAIYLLKKDLAQILEIRCDVTVTNEMDDRDKAVYLTTIVSALRDAGRRRRAKAFYGATALVGGSYAGETVERFRIVSGNPGDRKRMFAVSWFLILAVLFGISFAFTLHPAYERPGVIHITVTEPGVYEAEVENSFVDIMEKTEGTYTYLYGMSPP